MINLWKVMPILVHFLPCKVGAGVLLCKRLWKLRAAMLDNMKSGLAFEFQKTDLSSRNRSAASTDNGRQQDAG